MGAGPRYIGWPLGSPCRVGQPVASRRFGRRRSPGRGRRSPSWLQSMNWQSQFVPPARVALNAGLPFASRVACARSQQRLVASFFFAGPLEFGDAVALVEGHRARLALDARLGDRVGDGRAEVEEVGVAAAHALVLEVAVDDRQLAGTARCCRAACRPPCPARICRLQVNPASIVQVDEQPSPRDEVAVVARLAGLEVAVAAARVAGAAWSRAVAAVAAPSCRSSSSPFRRRRRGRSGRRGRRTRPLHHPVAAGRDACRRSACPVHDAPGSTMHRSTSSRRRSPCCRRRRLLCRR